MTRPSPFTGSGTQGPTNFEGEDGFYPTIATAHDPLATTAARVADTPSMTPAEIEDFLTAADRYHGPRLVGYRGYVNHWSSDRAYYLDDAGIWRDTVSDERWAA